MLVAVKKLLVDLNFVPLFDALKLCSNLLLGQEVSLGQHTILVLLFAPGIDQRDSQDVVLLDWILVAFDPLRDSVAEQGNTFLRLLIRFVVNLVDQVHRFLRVAVLENMGDVLTTALAIEASVHALLLCDGIGELLQLLIDKVVIARLEHFFATFHAASDN